MSTQDQSLGTCPACDTALIRNRRNVWKHHRVFLGGAAPPPNASYPDFQEEIHAVWCPGCGLAKSITFPQLDISWINPEFDGWIERRA